METDATRHSASPDLGSLRTRGRSLDFALLAAWLVGSAAMAAMAFVQYGQDFRGYYAAARVAMAGGNPYDYKILAPVLQSITGSIGNYPYYYAPWLAWSMMPLATLPFELARGVWMLFNLALWNVSLWQLGRWVEWPLYGWRRWLLFLVATVVFAWITWRDGQTGILLFALLMLTLLAIRNRHWSQAGLWLALVLVKPNITFLPVLAITLWLARRRIWRPIVSLCGCTLVMLGIGWLTIPNWYQSLSAPGFGQGLFDAISGPGQPLGPRLHATLHDWLVLLGVSGSASAAISIAAFLAGAAFIGYFAWHSESPFEVAAWSLLGSFAVIPYALQYDYPPLVIVFFWALVLGTSAPRRWAAGIAVALGVFVASVPFWERPISDGYWMVVGLIALTVWSLLTAGARRGQIGLVVH